MQQHSNYRRKKKGCQKIFEEIIVENMHNMYKKYGKTHTNQTKKEKTQRNNIKSSKGKATSNI